MTLDTSNISITTFQQWWIYFQQDIFFNIWDAFISQCWDRKLIINMHLFFCTLLLINMVIYFSLFLIISAFVCVLLTYCVNTLTHCVLVTSYGTNNHYRHRSKCCLSWLLVWHQAITGTNNLSNGPFGKYSIEISITIQNFPFKKRHF